jgi:signal transduction histidine kinase
MAMSGPVLSAPRGDDSPGRSHDRRQPMISRLTIFQKGLLLVAVPLLAQLALLGVLAKLQYDAAHAEHWAMHTKDVIAQAEQTFRRLLEAQTGVRGLVLTGNPEFAAAYHGAVARVPPDLDELQHMVSDNPTQNQRVRQIRTRADALLAWLGVEVGLVQSGRRAEAVTHLQEVDGKRLLDEARAALVDFLREEDRVHAEREADLRRTSARRSWALAAGGVLALGSSIVLALIFSRGVVRRLHVLRDNARRLAEGQGLATPLTGHDEVAEVDRAFHDMADSLAQKNQENELFVYSVSHDLRSPLVNLQGFSQELDMCCRDLRRLLDTPDVPPEVRRKALALLDDNATEATHYIQTAVSRLGRIIDALLRLSRAGRVEYQPQEVDVGAVVGRVVDALRGTIAARKAEVRVGPLPPPCWGDPTAVEQVFANLVGNAVTYLDPSRPGRVEVGSAAGDGQVLRTYFVRDNGLGIAEAHLKGIFSAFHRLHADAAQGEGVGLALVRRVVERHGGKIWVESTAGQGSTFYVALPAGPPAAASRVVPAVQSKGDAA